MPKRADGEGTLFGPDARGLYTARIANPDDPARPFVKRSTKQAVLKKWMDEVRVRLHTGEAPDPTRSETLETFLLRWIDGRKPPAMKPRAHRGYELIVKGHLIPGLGRYQLHQLSRQPELVQRFLDKSRVGRSGGTVVNIRSCLRSALGDAKRWGLISRNVAADDHVTVKNVVREERQPLTTPEAERLLEGAHGTRFEHMWGFAIATGLRLAELQALRWSDVDLEATDPNTGAPRPWIRVQHSLVWLPGQPPRMDTPKSKRGRRPVTLPAPAATALRAQKDRQTFERRTLGDAYLDGDFVFAQPDGQPFTAGQADYDFKKLVTGLGLSPDYTPHNLRHTCITWLRAAGVPDRVIQDVVGHSNLAMVHHYQHPLDEQMLDAVDRYDAWLSQRNLGASRRP